MSGLIYKQVVQRGHPRTNQGKVFEHILIADRPGNLVFYGSSVHHGECYNRYRRDLYAAGRGKKAKGKSQRRG